MRQQPLPILQAQLKPDRVERLKKAVPEIKEDDIKLMKRIPFRSYDESIVQEQLVYRLKEVCPDPFSALLSPTEALK